MRGKGSIDNTIINLIRYGNSNVIQTFLYNFPNYISLFNDINNKLNELPNVLYNLYVDRFITHKINYINGPAKHKFLLDIHKIYLSNNNKEISKLLTKDSIKTLHSNVNLHSNSKSKHKSKSIKLVDIINKLFITDVKIISELIK
jgi:hypothetical protein